MAEFRRARGSLWVADDTWAGKNGATPNEEPKKHHGLPGHLTEISREGYNIRISTTQLQRAGFHPKVTAKTLKEYLAAWLAMRKRMMAKPAPEPGYFGPLGFGKECITLASFVPSPEFRDGKIVPRLEVAGNPERCSLQNVLAIEGIGTLITEDIFADGIRAAQSRALASSGTWTQLAANVGIWNFTKGEFDGRAASPVFIAVAPQYKVRHLRAFLDEEDAGNVDENSNPGSWCKALQEDENDLFARINKGLQALTSPDSTDKRDCKRDIGSHTMTLLEEFLPEDDILMHRQLDMVDPAQDEQKLQLCRLTECSKMNDMIGRLATQCHLISVLYFEKIPLLDRRLLAIVLRGCPKVTTLGVYNCPLIHIGDVICILDLIDEINREREALEHPKIESFDFFPSFETGMACEGRDAAVYGLFWNPVNLDTTQRGLYAILLKAFMKAQAMGIGLLFDKDKALQDWLFKLPNLPWNIPIFFDALYRLMDAPKMGQAAGDYHKQAIWDLKKAVRLGIDDKNWGRGEPKRYQKPMSDRVSCASCGYTMMEELFRPFFKQYRGAAAIRRCAGCELQQALDEQNFQHQLYHMRLNLDNLFPDWVGTVYNHDAPLSAYGRPVIELLTSGTTVRNPKISLDSLMGLPTLEELTSPGYFVHWQTLARGLFKLSAFRCVARMIVDQRPSTDSENEKRRFRQKIRELMPNGKPDNFNEFQAETSTTKEIYTYDNALMAFGELVENNYLPYGPNLEDLLDSESMQVFVKTYDAHFW